MIDRRTLIASAAATAATAAAASAMARTVKAAVKPDPHFPSDFLWGAATAAYQVEGNNLNSDVWPLEHAEHSAYIEPSGDAANSFVLWRTDLDLVKAMGLNTYRFSLEWGRIEPAPGQFSIAMLDHYKAMIEGCRERGLTPIVTFNHFTTPVWFAASGGWYQKEAPAIFARFCGRAARHLAAGIGYALTLNEPNLIGMLPMLLPKDSGARLLAEDRVMSQAVARSMNVPLYLSGNGLFLPDAAVVQANLIAGHKAAREAMKAARPDLPVGVSLAMNDDHAVGPNSMRDRIRSRLYDPWLEAARADDFIGVQNYWRAVWDATHRLPAPAGVMTDENGTELYAPSLANAARYAHAKCGRPVVVTEHGCNVADDTKRARFIPAALVELRRAMDEGLPVRGYTHWSLIDNYEWFCGYKPQYGLHTLDRNTFARTPKPSAAVLGDIARRNSL